MFWRDEPPEAGRFSGGIPINSHPNRVKGIFVDGRSLYGWAARRILNITPPCETRFVYDLSAKWLVGAANPPPFFVEETPLGWRLRDSDTLFSRLLPSSVGVYAAALKALASAKRGQKIRFQIEVRDWDDRILALQVSATAALTDFADVAILALIELVDAEGE